MYEFTFLKYIHFDRKQQIGKLKFMHRCNEENEFVQEK